jgi:hypothetical protein
MSAERRRYPRLRADIADVAGVIVVADGERVTVDAADVDNISVGGAAVTMPPLRLGSLVQVELLGLSLQARVVRVRLDGRLRGAPVPTGNAFAFVEPQPSQWAALLTELSGAPRPGSSTST